MKLSEVMRQAGIAPSSSTSRFGQLLYADGVPHTAEIDRIVHLPRRRIRAAWIDRDGVDAADPIPDATGIFRVPGGTMTLRPLQSLALIEASECGGLIGLIGVGVGKTLVTLLLPEAMESVRAVLFIPAALRPQLLGRMLPDYRQHFRMPTVMALASEPVRATRALWVLSYHDLQQAKNSDLLEKLAPDLLIFDEAHNLRHRDTARFRRVKRYMDKHPLTRVCALSGTLIDKSVFDYAHLAEWALRKHSPLPYRWSEVKDFSAALDLLPPGERKLQPGALRVLQREGEDIRSAFRRRLTETPGVVASREEDLRTSLVIARAPDPAMPPVVAKTLADLNATWEIGEEAIESPMRLAEVARQVASGFYYVWDWGENGPTDRDLDWMMARSVWHKALANFLRYRAREGLDSPLLVTNAIDRGDFGPLLVRAEREGDLVSSYVAYKALDREPPPVVPVWLDDYLIQYAARWAERQRQAGEPSIVWYGHTAVGSRLANHLPVFGAGGDAALLQVTEPVIACSIRAHGTGKNLQRFRSALVLAPPSNAGTWEQLLGRLHRQGQEADEVRFDVVRHGPFGDAWDAAMRHALHLELSEGPQKLCFASKIEEVTVP